MVSENRSSRLVGPLLTVGGIVAAIGFTLSFPAVEGLGTKVRLPVFHGAMTWVNLALFSVLAVLALVYVVRRRAIHSTAGSRPCASSSVPMWIVGSALGFMAALNTWDFTGSKASPLSVAAADPRLNAQFWIMMAGLGLLALGLVIEQRRWLALADVGFVAFAWVVLLRAILGPGRALHPDSPVMNSDEIFIKLMFFGIVAGIAVASLGAIMVVRTVRMSRPPARWPPAEARLLREIGHSVRVWHADSVCVRPARRSQTRRVTRNAQDSTRLRR